MKEITFLLILFIGNFAIAQKFKTSVILSSGISWYSSNNSDFDNHNKITKNAGLGFCFSGGFREEYYLPKLISLGAELNYVYAKGKFASSSPYMNAIPEIHSCYRNILSIQSIDVPFFIKIRTDSTITKGVYFYFGGGLSYIFQCDRFIDNVTTYDYSPEKQDISPVTHGTFTINNCCNSKIGAIGLIGFGKSFTLKNKVLLYETRYRFDFNNWIYPTVNNPITNNFSIKRQCFLFSLGIII